VGKVGVFEGAAGSAYVEHGNTKAFAVVYGPSEPRPGRPSHHDKLAFTCEYTMAPFSKENYRPSRKAGRKGDPEVESLLTQTFQEAVMCDLYARSEVTICIQILQSDGGNTMAAINAGTLALIDAGISMKDYVVACTAANLDGTAVLDANQPEASAQGAELMVAVLPKTGQVVSTQMSSRIHVDHFEPLLTLAQQGCMALFDQMHAKVIERTTALAGARLGE
jgi:exosome complex component RRP41